LQALKGTGLEIKIELKGPNTVRPVLEIVDRLGMTSQCSYSSFDHANLRLLRQLRPSTRDYPTGALFNTPVPADYVSQAQACGATQVHLRYDTCTKERVHDIRTAGLQSMAWLRGPLGMANVGTDEEDCYRTLGETGVDQICCNRPDVAMQLQVLHARQP
jgi:glycerophosphoryl diester phosphodiesterase